MRPPILASLLFRLGRHGGRRAELAADLDDLFARRAGTHGVAYARRRYWKDVLSFYTPGHFAARLQTHTPASAHQRSSTVSTLGFDLRQLLRALFRQPGFFVVSSLTLAVGFAAHLSAFTLVDRMLLAPPSGIVEPERVARLHIEREFRGGRFLQWQTPAPVYRGLRQTPETYAAMAGYRSNTSSVGAGAEARQINIVFADADYFPLLGASARLGRVFTADEDKPPSGTPVAVLSDAYWRTAFASNPGVIGQSLRIGSVTYTVIGVMPSGFNADITDPIDVWAPFYAGAYELPTGWDTSMVYRSVNVITRLAPGVTKAAAEERTAAMYKRFAEGTPAADKTARALLAPLEPGRTQQGTLNPSGQVALWIEGVAVLVLLVAIANVVNLQMSRATQRRRELAVRVALGAGRGRLLAHVTLEMLLIAGVAAIIGAALTYISATALQRLLLTGATGTFDGSRFVLMAVGTLIAVTALCVGLSSTQARTQDVTERLKSGRGGEGFSRERLRQSLLVVQVVMSALLLVGAGLFMKSMHRLGKLDFGHDHDRVLVVTMPLRGAGYANQAVESFFQRALQEVAAVPGIERVAAAQSTPFAPSQSADLRIPGMERLPFDGNRHPTFYTVTPGYFATMGMKILRGRAFTDADKQGAAPVMILEEALAKAIWPNEEALGRCIVVGATSTACREIVGITTNTRRFVQTADSALRYYLPLEQRLFAMTPQALFVRTTGDPAAAAPAVRSALLQIDGNLPHIRTRTLDEMAEPEKRQWRLGSTVFLVFGIAALLVATSGVYALLSFMVTQRSREIGVRLALGASPAQTLRMIVRQSVGWAAVGVVIGLIAAAAAGKFMAPLLFETSPNDVTVFSSAAVLLVVVAVAASLGPALRASRLDPNVTLRTE